MAQTSSWPLEGTEGTKLGLIPRPELPPALLPAWAVEGSIGMLVPAVTRATEEEHGAGKAPGQRMQPSSGGSPGGWQG